MEGEQSLLATSDDREWFSDVVSAKESSIGMNLIAQVLAICWQRVLTVCAPVDGMSYSFVLSKSLLLHIGGVIATHERICLVATSALVIVPCSCGKWNNCDLTCRTCVEH